MVSSASTRNAGVAAEPLGSELEAILDISGYAFVIYDVGGAVRLASKRLRQLFDLKQTEWANLRDFCSVARAVALRLANPLLQLDPPWVLGQRGEGATCERLEMAEAGRILERTARHLVDDSGHSTGWVELYRDFRIDRELPARMLQTDKLAALGQMVAGIAHELNNPLTSIMGYSHLLLERRLDGKSLSDVHRIFQEAERAARVVRSLLMLAREAKLERTLTHLNEIVERTFRLCAYDLQRVGITTELDLDPELPPTLANPVQLQQVLLNLVVNSQQAISETGRHGRIRVCTRQGSGCIFLQVEDDGPGIPVDLQERIFDPFFTTKPVGIGTGLGLSIVNGILHQHGGEIRVASTPGAGTSFTLSVPVAAERAESAFERVSPGEPAPSSRILVAENEPGIAQLMLEALGADGHQVEVVTDGEQVLRRLDEAEYDLVICDWLLRNLNGPAVYRKLANGNGHGRSRLLVVSSDATIRTSSDFLREVQPAFLSKPFLLPELRSSVAGLLLKQKRLGQSHFAPAKDEEG